MSSTKRSEKRRMPEQALVRLDGKLAERIDKAARAAGLTVPAWLRLRAAEAVGAPMSEVKITRPRRLRQKRPSPEQQHLAALLVEVAALRSAVGELGGAMVQAAIKTKVGYEFESYAEIERPLPSIRAASGELQDLRDRLREALEAPSE
jgi:hypothetical protein